MKKVLSILMAAGMLLGFAGVASAKQPEGAGPGPNTHNEKGLCTAYFNGQKNGHAEGEGPGPFGALEDDATAEDATTGDNTEEDDELQVSDDVFEYCQTYGIGGNPEQNGRFDCSDDPDDRKSGAPRDTDGDHEFECVENGTEVPPVEG